MSRECTEGPQWRLRRLDREHAQDYRGVDVTPDIFRYQALMPVIKRHVRDA